MAHIQIPDERIIWEKWRKSREPESGDQLVKLYMPLVTYHVQRIAAGLPQNVSREDLKSFGLMGLLDAIEKFDLTRELKFETYASFRIRGAIMDGLRKEDWLPRSTREKAKKIEAVQYELEQKYMRHVSAQEIADELGMSESEVTQTMGDYFFAQIYSMDEHLTNDEDHDSSTFVIKDEESPGPEEMVIKDETLEEMARMITKLTENEQMVLSLFYQEGLTLTEIGEILELSTSRISQIHSKALFTLRRLLLRK